MKPTILDKYLAKSKEIKQSWTRLENFDISFCVSFDHYYQNLISGGIHWALGTGLSSKMTNSPNILHRGNIFCCADLI